MGERLALPIAFPASHVGVSGQRFRVSSRTLVTGECFDSYLRFAAERMRVFHRRAAGMPGPWTDDPVLARHKFTNVYRAADRVSQYLIRDVTYTGPQDPGEVVFRVLLFKFFNRIETWELAPARSPQGPVRFRCGDALPQAELFDDLGRAGQRRGRQAGDGPRGHGHLVVHADHLPPGEHLPPCAGDRVAFTAGQPPGGGQVIEGETAVQEGGCRLAPMPRTPGMLSDVSPASAR